MSRKTPFASVLKRRLLWLGTILVSSASAANAFVVAPQEEGVAKWHDMRRELERAQSQDKMSDQVHSVLARLENGDDYLQIMLLSYSAARPEDLPALDEFWTRFLAQRRDNDGFVAMLRARSNAVADYAMDRQTYLKEWLYLAQNGNYDCGSGGGNCGVGVGNGGGDGTTNEGGGNGDTPDGDGDQGGGNDDRPGNI